MLDASEVAKHNSRNSCWLILQGKAYDVTDYLDSHPGGAKILLKYGGKDATAEYEPIHPPGTIEKTISPERHLGPVSLSTLPSVPVPTAKAVDRETAARYLHSCMSLDDIEAAAEKVIPKRAWVYFHSAADDLRTVHNNRKDWLRVSLRPRILQNVERVDMRRSILGFRSSLPFCIAPAALAKLAHPDGELCLARGAARANIPYCVSTYSSVSHDDLAHCLKTEANGGGCLFFQLYINKSRQVTMDLISLARRLGFRALVVTVDTATVGKREEDERFKAAAAGESGPVSPPTFDFSSGPNRPVLRGVHSSTFSWTDLAWVREAWEGPLVIKGVQTVEDAKLAVDMGVDGIYLSNHGGRQCDDAPSGIKTLLEIRRFCPSILAKTELWLDGGIRRGTDVLKALCLGATTVFLGRPFLYALGVHGTEGVLQAIKILSDEIETTMRLIGVTRLTDLHPEMVNYSVLEKRLPQSLSSFPADSSSKL